MHSSRSSVQRMPSKLVKPPTHFAFEAIGTQWTVDLFESPSTLSQKQLLAEIQDRINVYDHHYSRFRADSLISRIAKRPGTFTLPPDGKKLFDLYAKLYKITAGKVTPLVGNLLSDAGYDAQYSLRPKSLREVPKWEEVLEYSFPTLSTRQPVLLDLGAAGKGYLVDIIGELLEKQGITAYCINAGGDILARLPGQEMLQIGLEHPDDPEQIIGVYRINKGSICGSAGNRRAWGEFHHIIDPHLQQSPRHIKAVWVQARTALVADALATCLFFVSASELAKYFTFEYAIVDSDNGLSHSAQFAADFFEAET